MLVVARMSKARRPVEFSERELVDRARAGDEDAFARLIRRYTPGLYRMAARITGDDEEAWDVLQLAFLRAWQKLGSYNPRWRFSTWLYKITANIALDAVRARASRRRAHEAGGMTTVSRPRHPSEAAEAYDVSRVTSRLLARLPRQQRAAFVLRELEGLPTKEVSKILGIGESTVRHHVFQARKTLAKILTEEFPEYSRRGGGR